MNYYNPGKRSIIADILSPINTDGFNVEHQKIQKLPIGSLDRRYKTRFAYRHVLPKQADRTTAHHYTFVPPLSTLRNANHKQALPDKVKAGLAALGLTVLETGHNLKSWFTSEYKGIKYHGFDWRYAVIPLILVLAGVIWLLQGNNPTAFGGIHAIQSSGQLIPVNNPTNNRSDNGNHDTNLNTAAADKSSAQNVQGSAYIPVSSSGFATGGSPSTSSGSSNLLPMYITVPPVYTSTPDGKTLLDSSGTTLKVN